MTRPSEAARRRREWLELQAVVLELATIQVIQRIRQAPTPTDALIRARLSDARRALDLSGYLVLLRRDTNGPLQVWVADGVKGETALTIASQLATQPAFASAPLRYPDLAREPGPLVAAADIGVQQAIREGSLALLSLSPDGSRSLGTLVLLSHQVDGIADEVVTVLERSAHHIATASEHRLERRRVARDGAGAPAERRASEPTDRDGLRQAAEAEARRSDTNSTPMSVVAVQIDSLRRTLAETGADAGVQLLRQVAGSLADLLRGTDIVGRLDGGRFAAVLGDCGKTGARHVAAKLRSAAGELAPDRQKAVALSVGLATRSSGESGVSVLAAAELALAEAVAAGGDRTSSRETARGTSTEEPTDGRDPPTI